MVMYEGILLSIGLLGHLILWPTFVNRVHSWAIPRWIIHGLTVFAGVMGGVLPLLIFADYFVWGFPTRTANVARILSLGYASACSLFLVASMISELFWIRRRKTPKALLENHTQVVDMEKIIGENPIRGGIPAFLSRLPGNQLLQLWIQKKSIAIPNLAQEHEGLRICQITDLHMSGRVDQSYFEEVVRQANDLAPDLTVITGDIFDNEECFDWGVATLAKLKAAHGVYFIFGNHDLLVDHARAKRLLIDAGLMYLGGRWCAIDIGGVSVILAGNELPWFTPAADVENIPETMEGQKPLRVLLSHAPDQIEWAASAKFDLMLAGHTHGGQIRFPVIGALACPSKYGTRYACGTFKRGSTIMHVSRGTSSLTTLRIQCPPELSLLQLVTEKT